MKTSLLAVFAILILAIAASGCAQKEESQFQAQPPAVQPASQAGQAMEPEPQTQDEPPAPPTVPEAAAQPKAEADHTVKITAQGFEPATLTIKAGQTVAFVNEDSKKRWPASAVHPSHKAYPGSDIAKCGTAESSTIFDACKALQQGEAFTFRFDNKGTWGYHDHWAPAMKGTIVVE